MPWHPVPSRAAPPNLFGECTLQYGYYRDLSRLPSGIFNSHWRLAWIVCFLFGIYVMLWSLLLFFINEEYLIALVDFIAPCGGTIERGERDLRIPFSPPSGLPPSFLGDRCGGLMRLPRVYRDIGFRYPVLSLIATSTWCLGALCSGLDCMRFSRSCLACIFRFSLLGGKKTLFV